MFECPPLMTRVISGLQKVRTDLRIVSSGRSFQIVCSAVSGPLRCAVSVSDPGTSTWLLARHKQTSNIWCKNIHAFLRYSDFRAAAFYFVSPCIYHAKHDARLLHHNNDYGWMENSINS